MTGTEPSNADIMAKLLEISNRLDKGDARFTAIDTKLAAVAGLTEAAATLVQVAEAGTQLLAVAETYKLAEGGGKFVKRLLGFLVLVGSAIAAVKAAMIDWQIAAGGG